MHSKRSDDPAVGTAIGHRQAKRLGKPKLVEMADRLRAMGASWMRLEKIQTAPPNAQYRFVCRVPLPNNPVYMRQFQADSASATAAVQRVTQEIQRWINGETTTR